ncbi:MAG: BamA/TamA family outer membrane protein [Methyloprofundus sp.]|nr:BamA/TamA family outer membrane protein [Methyloprofundus sp.]MDT8425003.1 BamA/TamA family outer membrane protein [Methyloprofundus sp.]
MTPYLSLQRFCYIGLLLLQISYSGVIYASPEIKITGLTSGLEANARAYLALSKEACDAPQWKIKHLFAESPEQLEKALRALGYYHPKIQQTLTWQKDCWASVFNIQAGPPMLIKKLDIQVLGVGAQEPFFAELLKNKRLKLGSIINHAHYEALKSSLQTIAEAKGYFDNHFELKRLAVDLDSNTAQIQLHLQTGNRYFISRIDIVENALDPEFGSKFLKIKPGDAYDREKIVGSYQLLDTSGYYKDVQLKYLRKQAENYYAPLDINLTNLPRHALSAGLGYDTNLGVRISGGYKNRYLNESGHQFIADLNLSLKKSNFIMEYVLPYNNPLKDRLSFFSGITYENTTNVDSQKIETGVRLSNRFYGQLLLSEQLKYVAERFRNSNSDPYITRFLLVPGIAISNARAEKKDMYITGYKYMLDLNAAHRAVASSVSFIQAKFNLKMTYPTFLGGRIIARTDLGATAVDVFTDLPSSYRFYAGGDNSVRGYDYKSIGERDESGVVIGGRYLVTGSLEYEQKIIDNWSMAAFIDAGDAFSKTLKLKFGAGLGVRWYSIVGPVRIDIAAPTDNIGDVHFHFSLSTAI